MYSVEKTDYGYKLEFGGFMKAAEIEDWLSESRKALVGAPKDFTVLIDMRTLKPLPEDAQKGMEEGQKLFKQRGMIRSAVILNNALQTMQFKRIAKETGIYQWERYIDASKVSDWQTVAMKWLKEAIDPDK